LNEESGDEEVRVAAPKKVASNHHVVIPHVKHAFVEDPFPVPEVRDS